LHGSGRKIKNQATKQQPKPQIEHPDPNMKKRIQIQVPFKNTKEQEERPESPDKESLNMGSK
jgi:hypothetical protein